jgi:hypothetical protein
MNRWEWLWEAPLGAASYGFHKLARKTLHTMFMAHSRSLKDSPAWRPMTGALLGQPLALPYIMATGPRWNTWARTANAGPFDVQRTIRFDPSAPAAMAEALTFVVYRLPAHEMLGSYPITGPGEPVEITVDRPSRVFLNVRIFGAAERDVPLPAVTVDGEPRLPEAVHPADANTFLGRLRERKNPFYRAQQFFVYPMLAGRRFLPEGLVDREFLPVGNPETAFRYGPLDRGHSLHIVASDALRARARVHVTLYDRQSFPIHWATLDQHEIMLPPQPVRGFYLVRVHARQGRPELAEDDLVISERAS